MSGLELKAKAKDIVLKGKHLTDSVLHTMDVLSQVVGSTLGPGGHVVLLERPGLPPLVTKDGVTVAMHCAFPAALDHVIGEAAKEAALKTNTEAGDGTTTAIVLAEAITRRGLEYLKAHPSKSPQEICRELDLVVEAMTAKLAGKAVKVTSKEDLTKVALVSANFDRGIADAVVGAMDLVGDDGTIITEEGSSRHTTVELQEGFPVKKGLHAFGVIQEIFVNDPHAQECVLSRPLVLLYNGDLTDPIAIGQFLDGCFNKMSEAKDLRPLIIVAHKFSPQVLHLFAMNFKANRALLVPLETPSTAQANSRHHFLGDLAAYTGGDVLDPIEATLDKSSIENLGGCGRARLGRYQSVFLDPVEESKEGVEARVASLKDQQTNAESEYDAEIIKERVGQLLGGIATIFVGGSSDLEIKEKKHRIEDAINATRSAVEQGILPGGGATLMTLASASVLSGLEDSAYPKSAEILAMALAEPFERIARNAGESTETMKLAMVEITGSQVDGIPTKIWDALRHEMVDPYEAGIVDPVKVTISALQNAFSISQMLFTLGGAIVLPRDANEEAAAELAAQNIAAQMQSA